MDDVLLWFTANRDTLIVGVVVGIVIAIARWGAAIFRRGSGLVRKRINDRRCKKAEEARQEQEAAERKEQEAQRKAEQLRWRERSLNEYDPPPKTYAGQVIAGALVGTGWRWTYEHIDGKFVVLGFVIGRGFRGEVSPGVGQPVLEAARQYQSSSPTVEWCDVMDSQQMYPYGHVRMGIRVSRSTD